MTRIFEAHTDTIIYMDAEEADRKAGGLIRWNKTATGFTPSGHTWNIAAAASMTFTFMSGSGTHHFYLRGNSGDQKQWMWVTIDGRSNAIGTDGLGRLFFNSNLDLWHKSPGSGFTLTGGKHTITLHSIHENMNIDRIAVVPDAATGLLSDRSRIEGGPSVVSGSSPVVETDSYIDWLGDETRDPVRALLLEFNYDGGAVRFASSPYLSNKNLAYDDGIYSDPFIEESMGSEILVGDVEVVVEEPENDLMNLNFRGYTNRWLFGDLEWDIEKFKVLTSNTIEACRLIDKNHYQFDLIPPTDIYNRTFYVGAEITRVGVLRDEFEWLFDQFVGSSSVRYINIDPGTLNTSVSYLVNDTSTMDEILTLLCDSIGAFYRTSQLGEFEIVVSDRDNNPAINFTSDNIINDSVVVQEVIPAKKRLTIEYGVADDFITIETEAVTGSFDDEIVIKTALVNLSDARDLAYQLADVYGRKQILYSMDVYELVDVIVVGDFCTVTSEIVNTVGVVSRIKRTPLTAASTIEVLV